ncbi:atypical chemokine receptor 4b [Denticeps clupeoides]|uniref:G-protein coupled receptors family 1 profile domain-containing protein n=1 Tax=Denticeps clupeoides TaxID=299321 RepID=A0AAY4DN78_9TELE|nr:atypical chemokine receptor 4-like [Denticeps clupeoides]
MDHTGAEDYEHENFTSDYYDDFGVCDKQEVRSFAGLFLPMVYALALVVGLAGNSLVVVVYLAQKRLRTLTDVYILNLAFADLLLLLTLPFWAADAVNGWEIGVAACKLTSALYATNFNCGMLLLACISVDRYRALTAHQRSLASGPAQSSPHRQRVFICLLVWLTASVLGLPDMVFSTVTQHSGGRKACHAVYPSHMAQAAKASLELLEVSLAFLLPFVVMLVCYGQVGRVLSQAASAGVRGVRRWKAFRVLVVVVGVFLLTQLPYNVVKLVRAMDIIYMLVQDCEVSKSLDRATQVTESLALTHCCLNPMLYAFVGSSFRMHVLKAAKRFTRTGRHYSQQGHPELGEVSLQMRSQANAERHSESEQSGETSTFTI